MPRRAHLSLFTAWVLAALLSCTEEPPTKLDEVGDPCRVFYQFCVDDESVQRCEDDLWAITSCDTVCAEFGPAYISDGCEDHCVCVLADPLGCIPGETLCVDEDSVNTCSETQAWQATSCADQCAAAQLEPVGCLPATEQNAAGCWCTAEGTPCEADAAPLCMDGLTLAQCIGGAWTFEDCTAGCPTTGQCNPWAELAACEC